MIMKNVFTHIVLALLIGYVPISPLHSQIVVNVTNINPGSGDSNPMYITGIANKLYFSAKDNSSDQELWSHDLTSGTSQQIADINIFGSSNPRNLTVVNGKLFFVAEDLSHGEELWMYDPVSGDTNFLRDIYLGPTDSKIENMIDVNGILFFSAKTPSSGIELWRSDGTPNGTDIVADINSGSSSSISLTPGEGYFTNINDTLYFVAQGNTTGRELWMCPGSMTGVPSDISLMPANQSSNPSSLTNVNGTLYFWAYTSALGAELFKLSSLTPVCVADIMPGQQSSMLSNYIFNSEPPRMIGLGDTLFFGALDSVTGSMELHRTNGSNLSETLVKDIYIGANSSFPGIFCVYNNKVFFAANGYSGNTLSGSEPHFSDGTPTGTQILKDCILGQSGSDPSGFIVANNTLFFIAEGPNYLYMSDGTTSGTIKIFINGVDYLTVHNGTLFFKAHTPQNGQEIYTFSSMNLDLPNNDDLISIYPNPSSDLIQIDSKNIILDISIYSLTGQLLQQQKVNQTCSEQIDLNTFDAGVYIAVITTAVGKSSQRIIKQ
jgi:ELWxxDGT repeat protein